MRDKPIFRLVIRGGSTVDPNDGEDWKDTLGYARLAYADTTFVGYWPMGLRLRARRRKREG